jgi:uncharacterized membrane protein
MGIVMIDENTIAHIERLRDRDKTVFNCERDHMLKGFYEQVRQERMEQKKIKRTLKIIVISFILLMTVMSANVQTLSSWEKKAIGLVFKYPHSYLRIHLI